MRLRLIGGQITGQSLAALGEVARTYGDGELHLTKRANLQLRALPATEHGVAVEVVEAIEATGLLPSRTHELVRNVMVSPQTGLSGGRTDLRPVAEELDRLLCEDPGLAGLPGRFLFALDDGRGDLAERTCDLGLVALDGVHSQFRVGSLWGPVLSLDVAASALLDLARRFLASRGEGPDAAWHVEELPDPLVPAVVADQRATVVSPPLAYGSVAGGTHVEAPGGVLDAGAVEQLSRHDRLVVTPWHGVLVPDQVQGR